MNVDTILQRMNRQQVRYLLIGGMNFLLRHRPLLTYDVDLWIEDTPSNRENCLAALILLDAEWGSSDSDWGPVRTRDANWLTIQSVYCLTSPHGAIDIFRSVRGLPDWSVSFSRSIRERTAGGISYYGICDRDMLACQTCLPADQQKIERMAVLEQVLRSSPPHET